MNFVLALAYHFWLNLPAAFTQPGACLLVELCTRGTSIHETKSCDIAIFCFHHTRETFHNGWELLNSPLTPKCLGSRITQPSHYFLAKYCSLRYQRRLSNPPRRRSHPCSLARSSLARALSPLSISIHARDKVGSGVEGGALLSRSH